MMARARILVAAVGAAVVMASGLAEADESQRVVFLGSTREGEATASGIASHLAPPYTLVDAGAFRSALGSDAKRLLSLAAKRHDKDAELVARARAAERSAHVDKAILVHAERTRKAWVVHVWLIDAQGSGGAAVDEDVRLGAGARVGDGGDAAWNVVASGFPQPNAAQPLPSSTSAAADGPAAEPPAAAAPLGSDPSVKAADADVAAGRPHPSDSTRAASFAVLEAAMQGGSRHFSYVDRLTPTLRSYDLFVAPLLAVHGEIYPFVSAKVPVLSGLGASGSYARAFALGSADAAGNQVGTSWEAFDLGMRERLSIGDSFILGIDVGYGENAFAFDATLPAAVQLPSIHYKMVRGGLDGRVVRGNLSVHAAASYLDVLSTGDFGALFPRTSVGGVEAVLGVSDTVAPSVELSLDVVYTRFFYDLLPQPGDTYVAGGALDQMATVSLGFAYLF